ncbi:MAG: zf-HC2 domain-containing protein [Oscillospiraceae bacterium]|nr:zf-HC2 domain-containing protein [Oscillospiraceae bacterium]
MNENQITCDICRDLFPLVKDGVASADSETAVRRHIGGCRDCGQLFDGEIVTAEAVSEPPKALLRVKRRLTGVYMALMMLGIYFGLSLTASDDVFFNCLVMPFAGVFGYLVFRWKSVFAVPVILLILNMIINALGFFGDTYRLDFSELVSWTIIYSLFALAGIVIAMLLHYAFGKAKPERSDKNER